MCDGFYIKLRGLQYSLYSIELQSIYIIIWQTWGMIVHRQYLSICLQMHF